ncbi:hypothetical protein JCM16303_006451 [Sporobolomyces ruberrimus]
MNSSIPPDSWSTTESCHARSRLLVPLFEQLLSFTSSPCRPALSTRQANLEPPPLTTTKMNRTLSPARVRALYLSITSSRLIYVVLVDTALTFILFTFLYHHHFTSLHHSSTILSLCRSLRANTSIGLPPPFQSICHEASVTLNAPPTFIQNFLSVTREVVGRVGPEQGLVENGREYAKIGVERNWKVVKFVLFKIIGFAIVLGILKRKTTSNEDETGKIKLGGEGDCVLVVVEPTSPSKFSSTSPPPPPAYSPSSPRTIDLEEDGEDEDDLPWILLALSLIGHLSIVLFDQGAFDSLLKSSIVRDRWVVFGVGLFLTGMYGIWRESSRSRGRVGVEAEVVVAQDEKTGMVVIDL